MQSPEFTVALREADLGVDRIAIPAPDGRIPSWSTAPAGCGRHRVQTSVTSALLDDVFIALTKKPATRAAVRQRRSCRD